MGVGAFIASLIVAAGVPSAVCATCISKLSKRLDKKDKDRTKRDYLIVQGTIAAITLGEAQALELQKTGKTNGETKEALAYAQETKNKIREFYTMQGVENLK